MNYRRDATTTVEVRRQEAAVARAIDLTATAMDALRDQPIGDRLLAGIRVDLEAVLAGDERPMRRVKESLSRVKALQQLARVAEARHAELFSGATELSNLVEWKPRTAAKKPAPIEQKTLWDVA